jgi:exonuclease SbcD
LNTIDDLLDTLDKVCEDVRASAEGRASMLRLRLVGRGDLHPKLRHLDPERDLALPLREKETERPDFVWVEAIQVWTRPTIDIVQRREVKDFLGNFLSSANAMRTQPNYGEVILKLLTDRTEHRVISRQLNNLSDTDLLSILEEAETLGLDYLTEEQ